MAFGSLGGGDQDNEMAEINITPLVDVMLVLMIVFMISFPIITSSINVALPTSSATAGVQAPAIVNLAINAEGVYYLFDQAMSLEDIVSQVQAKHAEDASLVVAITADKLTNYEALIKLMDALRAVGVGKFAFVTLPTAG